MLIARISGLAIRIWQHRFIEIIDWVTFAYLWPSMSMQPGKEGKQTHPALPLSRSCLLACLRGWIAVIVLRIILDDVATGLLGCWGNIGGTFFIFDLLDHDRFAFDFVGDNLWGEDASELLQSCKYKHNTHRDINTHLFICDIRFWHISITCIPGLTLSGEIAIVWIWFNIIRTSSWLQNEREYN